MTVNEIEPLRFLDDIRTVGIEGCGIASKRIYKENTNVSFIGDCVEKFTFCIQDLNRELERIKKDDYVRMDIIYIILSVTWIQEAFNCIRDNLAPSILEIIGQDEQLAAINRFIKAARSFIVAHPLTTNRHEKFGLDGNYICVDIHDIRRNAFIHAFQGAIPFQRLSFDGIQKCDKIFEEDFCLVTYSQKADGMKYKQYIGCSFSDFYKAADSYIEHFYEIDKAIRRAASKHQI